MKKGLLLILLLALMLTLAACGETQPATEETTETATEETATESVTTNTATSTDMPYVVELGEAQMITNYDGEQLFTVFYTFTNNSEDTISPFAALYIKAFQDGIQLDAGYLGDSDLPEDKASTYDNDYKDVRPGATIECYEEFKLTSTSDVEVEVTEFISLDDTILASKVYSVQ